MIIRDFVALLAARLKERTPLIQVILGPRQVGKTTGVQQALRALKQHSLYVSADDTLTVDNHWIEEQWQTALRQGSGVILVIDEIQKIRNWSEVIKRLWDSQTSTARLRCVLLGSSSLSLQKGLTESLTGRFELIPVTHWSYPESRKAFHYNLPTYLRFGGYPGANKFRNDYPRWFAFLKSSVVDTVIGQDILTQQTVTKPALFRQAFEILCAYPAREVSYTTLLGQLHDRGNTDLVKHYLELYEGAYLFRGLPKYSGRHVKVKSSSPKIIPMCPALHTLAVGPDALNDPVQFGHVFEAAVGADLLRIPGARVYYWRDSDDEVDFVVEYQSALYALEVKSTRVRTRSGLRTFAQRFPKTKACVLTTASYDDFSMDPLAFLDKSALVL